MGNPNLPALHGGVIGSFLELTASSEWLFRTGEQDLPTTTSFSMNYLRSDRTQDTFGRAVITRQGRRISRPLSGNQMLTSRLLWLAVTYRALPLVS